MRRMVMFMLLVLMPLLLAACGGAPVDLSVVTPAEATVVSTTGNSEVDAILQQWQASVPASMQERQVKPETIKQETYTIGKTLEEVKSYYDTSFNVEKGWIASRRTPGLDAAQGVLVSGYENGVNSLIIGAIDQAQYGGEGVVVFTATGNK
ncbi:MAG: hypothetical protein H7Z42_16310 [Roseiflexaceae bacterium]|nr:hypothetical protein [Roseiflexaceae bacterium]